MEVIRAFELPLGGCDPSVWPLLRECWRNATSLANWCAAELFRHDVARTCEMKKLPKYPGIPDTGRGKNRRKGLYGLATHAFGFAKPGSWWAGACVSAATICRNVERKYRKRRYAVVWEHERPENYGYPYPWPVHASLWKAAWLDESGKPWVKLGLPGGSVELRLRGGPEFGRQMGHFKAVIKGDLPRIELQIRQQPCSTGCHRPHLVEKSPGGGQDRPQRVMVKMVARLPVTVKQGVRVLTLCTDPGAFWVAELDGRQAWVLHADHVRRAFEWQAVHEERRGRFAHDTKAERRLKTGRLEALNESRRRCCEKHARQMNSWLHEAAAHLAGFAVRQRVGHVIYRDTDKGFIPQFPWFELKTLLADKLAAAGIALTCASEEEEKEEEIAPACVSEESEHVA